MSKRQLSHRSQAFLFACQAKRVDRWDRVRKILLQGRLARCLTTKVWQDTKITRIVGMALLARDQSGNLLQEAGAVRARTTGCAFRIRCSMLSRLMNTKDPSTRRKKEQSGAFHEAAQDNRNQERQSGTASVDGVVVQIYISLQ